MADDYWDRMAATYETDNEYIAGPDLVAMMRSVVTDAVPDGDVVEFGCGTGWFTLAYASRCRSVLALDSSPAMLEEAARALGSLAHVSVRVADAADTGLADESADAVVIANVLDIVPDPGAIVAEAGRLLRPGGVLVVVNFAVEEMTVGQRLAGLFRLLRRWRVITGGRRGRFLNRQSLEELARSAGLETDQSALLRGRSMNALCVRAVRAG